MNRLRHLRNEKVSVRTIRTARERDGVLSTFHPEFVPFKPRNPQQHRAQCITSPPFVRLFALILLAMSAASLRANRLRRSVSARLVLHRLTYRCTNHENLPIRGYREEGTTSNGGNRATRPVPRPSKAGAALRATPVPTLPGTVLRTAH